MAVKPYYHLQCNFNAGEISRDVANQVTLEKYQYALTKAENCIIKPYGPVYRRPGTVYVDATKNNSECILVPFSVPDRNDYMLEFTNGWIQIRDNTGLFVQALAVPYGLSTLPKLRFAQSADVMFIASGDYPVKELRRGSTWSFQDYVIDVPYFDAALGDATEDCTITPSAVSGNSVTLTASENIFVSNMVGASVQLIQEVESKSVSKSFTSSDKTATTSVLAGEGWKIVTHGTWAGTIKIERSFDGSTWKEYRSYVANSDFNAMESGNVSEKMYLRIVATALTSGTCNAELTAMPYKHTGFATITAYTNAQNVTAKVIDNFGTTEATKNWSFSAWGDAFGYPRAIGFFQDRLCFGGNTAQPYMLWMSRTGDYGNFGVEKTNGAVTDDSAIAVSLISRKQYEIKHIIATSDLAIFTEGNEWIISGSEIVTPSKVTPKNQSARGCSDVEPILIGNKVIFVQSRGSIVRDMGYSYESDSYTGNDLTILASHLVNNKKIIDASYKQEPESVLAFVTDDGVINCLTYNAEQNVYAWSTIKTDGKFEAVCVLRSGNEDVVFVSVKRGNKHYIERFVNYNDYSANPQGYVCLDSASVYSVSAGTDTIDAGLRNAGKHVDILGDGRVYKDYVADETGHVTIPATVKNIIVGLPYTTNIELPNIEIKTGDGTMQGRNKDITECILRLSNTLGGYVGPNFNIQDQIKYDELGAVEDISLYSGDKKITLPAGGFNVDGRVAITSDMPYPFNLLMIVREVTFGG